VTFCVVVQCRRLRICKDRLRRCASILFIHSNKSGVYLKKAFFRCAILFAQISLISTATDSHVIAQAPNGHDNVLDNRPWEELPDGRIIVEIKGNKLAFNKNIDRDERYLSLRFSSATPSKIKELGFQDVVEHPGIARAVFKSWDIVRIHTQNSRSAPGLFLARYDRKTIPSSSRIELEIFSDPEQILCRTSLVELELHRNCARFNDLASGFRFRRNAGPIIVRHPKALSSETENEAGGWTTYVFPISERRSATHEAIYFQCEDLSEICRNNSKNVFGYAIRKNVSLYFEFSLTEFPKKRMRELDRRMREVFDDVLLNLK